MSSSTKFAEAVSLLEFTGTESLGAKETKIEIGISQLRALGFSEDKLEFIRGHLGTGEETLEDLERTVKEETKRIFKGIVIPKNKEKAAKDDCADGRHCQRIVAEEDLGPALEAGWRVVATLPSGKIVIER